LPKYGHKFLFLLPLLSFLAGISATWQHWVGEEGGWGEEGGKVGRRIHNWLPHVAKSPLKHTIPEILEKSLYYLYLSISIWLDR
jgi:hypothetical protein